MAATANPPPPANAPKRSPGPLAPPPSQFWEKYSPHYEFPLSSVGSVALHIGALLVFIAAIWLLARMTDSDRKPARMIAVNVTDGDGDAASGRGSDGGVEDLRPTTKPDAPKVPVEEKKLDPVLREAMKHTLPDVSSDADAPKIADLPNLEKIDKLNEDLKKAIVAAASRKKGVGPGDGKGDTGTAGQGSGRAGDPNSSAARSVRWELVFRTSDGRDYLRQLAAMKATLVIPNEDGKSSLVYRNLDQPKPTVEQFNSNDMPGLFFVDESAESADRIAKALGLNHSPKQFIGFFPKEIEEELANKEQAYRGRKAGEIFSTTFKVLVRDGKFAISVTDQVPVKR